MAQNIRVTPDELRIAAEEISSRADEYRSKYETVLAKVRDLGSEWSGRDNLEFTNKVEGFEPDLQAMFHMMMDYADFLRNAAKTYEDTQEAIRQRASKLSN